MSDREQLLEAVARGALVRPSSEQMDFVDVVRAIAHACGVEVPLNDHSRGLAAQLQGVDHLVFLMADGLGLGLVERTSSHSWIRRHTRRPVLATFPSTTTTAVTSLFTATRPATHGVLGWWVHLKEVNSPATVFQHDRAVDGRSLADLGFGVEALCSTPPVLPRMTRHAALLLPESITASPYTVHMGGTARRIGYRRYDDAVDSILRLTSEADGPTFTYWYTSSPDTEAHDDGSNSDRVFRSISALDQAAERLAAGLNESTESWRIVGTADHGHLALDPHLELEADHPLLAHLACPPSGDMRVQFWHVRPGSEGAFGSAFRHRFGQHFFLITARDLEELECLGAEPWSDIARQRVGTHVSISRGGAALRYAGIPGSAGYRRMRSGHSGLSPAEMRVPLIIDGDHTRRQDYQG